MTKASFPKGLKSMEGGFVLIQYPLRSIGPCCLAATSFGIRERILQFHVVVSPIAISIFPAE